LVKSAKGAAGRLSTLSTAVKNQALLAMADGLEAQEAELVAANDKDLEQFEVCGRKEFGGLAFKRQDSKLSFLVIERQSIEAVHSGFLEMGGEFLARLRSSSCAPAGG
jgi:gamma-glutamyl phosphate reductase